MNKITSTLICLFTALAAFSQSTAISENYSFSIKKIVIPPNLEWDGQPRFTDDNGNNAIDAMEDASIQLKIKNTGKGDGQNLRIELTATGTSSGVTYKKTTSIPLLRKDASQAVTIDILSDATTQEGEIIFTINAIEPNGFNADPINIRIKTNKFRSPDIQVVDSKLYSENGGNSLAPKVPFSIELLVQNLGQGQAEDVNLSLDVPQNVFISSGEPRVKIGSLKPGEKKAIVFDLLINALYKEPTLSLNARASESYGKYAKPWKNTYQMNQRLAKSEIKVDAYATEEIKIEQGSLTSDVDKGIPSGLPRNEKKYALIIGCEDYSRYQTGLTREVNVDFAGNDARIFAEYAIKTLGYPEGQVVTLIDPTASRIKQEIQKLVKNAENEQGKAELLFYYSGHGLPDNVTQEPYLIPVDVNGNVPSDGVGLDWLYKKLAEYPSAKVNVILDACFSGGARNKELIAMKGVKVKPKTGVIPANILVWASSSGSETSAVYREKQHGYFTYFILKNLKENGAGQYFAQSFDDIKYKVRKEALKIGKDQNPQIMPGIGITESWKNLKW